MNKKPINIIIQIDKEINTNIKDYCNYVDKVFVRKDLGIPASDKLRAGLSANFHKSFATQYKNPRLARNLCRQAGLLQ